MVAFLASPGPARNPDAALLLVEQMATSAEARDRSEAARVIALMPEPPIALLTRLIQDEDGEVAAQALTTAHSIGGGDAMAALGASLLEGIFQAGAPLRRRLIAALNKLRQRHPRMTLDVSLVELLLAAEIAGHYRSYQVLARLDAGGAPQGRVVGALRHTMTQELERIFRLIALLAPSASLHDAYVGVQSTNPLVRANAIEYLENVLKPELRNVLLPLIDSHVSERERAALAERVVGPAFETSEQAIAELLASDDPWLRSRAEIMANRVAGAGEEEYAPEPPSMDEGIGAG
jgi:hypothetical protein